MSIVNRERRKNAGKRMAMLGKKMEEEDETFWSHETWAEDADSGNESFHESDEDSALRKDVFDSDFNDSESDNEEDEVAAGEAEERELRKSERAKRRKKNNVHAAYRNLDVDTSTRGKGRKGVAGGMKRAIGEGFNAGIVLHLPPETSDSLAYMSSLSDEVRANQQRTQQQKHQSKYLQSSPQTIATDATPTINKSNLRDESKSITLPATDAPIPQTTETKTTATKKSSPRKSTRRATGDPVLRSSRVPSRERRATHGVRQLRDRGGSTPAAAVVKAAASKATASSGNKPLSTGTTSRASTAAKRKRIAQEELLLEAVHETEPKNQRWLYGRKRVLDQSDREKDLNANGLRDRYRGKKIIQKFHSRRGCLITLTFPEMDAVPEILTRRQQPTQQQQQQQQQQSQRAMQGAQQHSQQISLMPQQNQKQPNRCVITGRVGIYRDPITKHAYHDLAAFKELRRRHKSGLPIEKERAVVGSGTKSNGGAQGNKARKASPVTAQNEVPSRKKIAKDEKTKLAPSIIGSGKPPKSSQRVKTEQRSKTTSSSAICFNNKLPFQSPKPPSNGKAIQHGQTQNLEHLALSWGQKGGLSSAATNNNIIQQPLSPSGRRLSPRKWKPSEKVLETMAMMPGKDSAVPRGLAMQPKESASTLLPLPIISNPTPAFEALPLLGAQLTRDSVGSTTDRSSQETQTMKFALNGRDALPTNSRSAKIVSTSPLTGAVGNSPSNVITARLEDTSSDGGIVGKTTSDNSSNTSISMARQEAEKVNGSNDQAK